MGFDLETFSECIETLRLVAALHQIDHKEIGVVLPGDWYDTLVIQIRASRHLIETPCSPRTLLRAGFHFCNFEILRGDPGQDRVLACLARGRDEMIGANGESLLSEIEGCFQGSRIAKLPKSPSSNSVSPSAEPIGKIPVTPSPASGDDRNPNGLAHLSDETKVIAAKEAIAAYARNKQLPSAAHLALFGELDGKAAGNKGPGLGQAGWMPAPAWHAQIDRLFDDIKRNNHSLSAEPLSRAIDQIWVRENGGSYADLVCSRAERLAEMVYRGDAAADRERAE